MNKIFTMVFVLIMFFSVGEFIFAIDPLTPTPTTGPKNATCDLCGYCPPNPTPQNWEKCRDCLYPTLIGSTIEENKTLEIDSTTGLPPQPVSGQMYTQIGCIGTNLKAFTSSAGVAGVVQSLFNLIVTLAGGVAFLTIMYGAFILITSQSNPEKLDQGKRLIFGAVVGLVFILFSGFIVNFLAQNVFNIGSFK